MKVETLHSRVHGDFAYRWILYIANRWRLCMKVETLHSIIHGDFAYRWRLYIYKYINEEYINEQYIICSNNFLALYIKLLSFGVWGFKLR